MEESPLHGKTQFKIQKTKVSLESYKAYSEKKRFIVNQGGSRSGKTYSLINLLIGLALKERISVSICSIAFPHLRRGAIRDWIEIMEKQELYNPKNHRLTDQTYHFPNGSYIEFFSADDSGKVRGPGRDVLFCNEVNLFPKDTFEQLNLRTRKTVFMDYNPADEFHWLYDRILPLQETMFIQSTYKDNPFLPIEQVRQIENLKDADPDLWRVYGLGERGATSNVIFHHWQTYSEEPYGDYCYGLDFGYNHPNALTKVTYNDGKLYLEEKFYQSHTTTPELIEAIKPIVGNSYVYCDSARPDIIEELRRAGINAMPADKEVKKGLTFMRSCAIFVHQSSANLQKEMRTYKWKTKPNGIILDEPIKLYDDAIDAGRYGAISYANQSTPYLMFSP